MANEKIVILTEKDLSKMDTSHILTPAGDFKPNSKYDKGNVVYCGYSIYISLVSDNQALLSDTSAWRMLVDGSCIKKTIDDTNRLHEDIEQLKNQTDNIYSQENSRVTSENQRSLTFNKLVDNINTLIATASDNERSRSDAFNKNEQARQKDWYEQLMEDHNQYTKLWTEIKQNYNDFADGATFNEKTRQTVFDELKLALDNLKIDGTATNEQIKTALANAQIAETKATEAAAAVKDAVDRANGAADKANDAAKRIDDGVNAAKQAVDNANTAITKANTAITTANTAKTAADEAKVNSETAATNANAAADKANKAADNANAATANTNTVIDNVNTAIANANAAADKALKAAASVNEKVDHSQFLTKTEAEEVYIKKADLSTISLNGIRGIFNAVLTNSNIKISDIVCSSGDVIGTGDLSGTFTAIPLSNALISWSCSDNSLISVSDDGSFTTQCRENDATVTVTARIYGWENDNEVVKSEYSKDITLKAWPAVIADNKRVVTNEGSKVYYKQNKE